MKLFRKSTKTINPIPGITPAAGSTQLRQLEEALGQEKRAHSVTKRQAREASLQAQAMQILDALPEGVQLIRVKPTKHSNRYAVCLHGGYRIYGETANAALFKFLKAKPAMGEVYKNNITESILASFGEPEASAL